MGPQKIKLRLHRSLNLGAPRASLTYTIGGTQASLKFNKSQKNKSGDSNFELVLNRGEGPAWGDLFESHVAFVQVEGFKDWFPVDFRDVVRDANEMLSQILPEAQNLARGNLLDPENVSARDRNADYFPFLGMADPNFGQDIHGDRYFPVPGSGIHNEFPNGNGENRITAVGHGNTLVMIKAPAPFKLAYICFDRRNQAEEAKFGVPSGGGWHEIGDPAETVFNSLENEAALFGYANSRPASAPPSNGFAYGLTDIAVFRMLKPGTALVTASGPTTASEDASGWQNRGQQSSPGGRNFHWFAFHQPHEICALEWVHPHIPSRTNHLGLEL